MEMVLVSRGDDHLWAIFGTSLAHPYHPHPHPLPPISESIVQWLIDFWYAPKPFF